MILLNPVKMPCYIAIVDDTITAYTPPVIRDITTYTAIDDIIDGHQLALFLGFLLTFGL